MPDVVSIMSHDGSAQNQPHHPLPSSSSTAFFLFIFYTANSGAGLQCFNLINVHVYRACLSCAHEKLPFKYTAFLSEGSSSSDPLQFKTGLSSYFSDVLMLLNFCK